MATLRDVLIYLCTKYPNSNELSKARLAKMVYLADWRSAITRGEQITETEWIYNHYGPYVREVEETANVDGAFEVERTTNVYGHDKDLIRLRAGVTAENLTVDDKDVLDHVIETTSSMYWSDFLKLVYSTYPILTQPRFAKLDLVELARAYKKDRQRFAWGEQSDTAPTNQVRA